MPHSGATTLTVNGVMLETLQIHYSHIYQQLMESTATRQTAGNIPSQC